MAFHNAINIMFGLFHSNPWPVSFGSVAHFIRIRDLFHSDPRPIPFGSETHSIRMRRPFDTDVFSRLFHGLIDCLLDFIQTWPANDYGCVLSRWVKE